MTQLPRFPETPAACPPPHETNGADDEYDGIETEHDTLMSLGFPARTIRARLRDALRDDSGAVTAEYALIIMAGVAFAGALILIMRSEEVRAMLLNLVQNALASAG